MLASAQSTLLFVDLKQPVAHLRTEFQNVVMGLMAEVGVRTLAPYVSIGRMARVAALRQFCDDRPFPAEEKRWMRPKASLAEASLRRKCVLGLKAWESQKPTHLTWWPGWKS